MTGMARCRHCATSCRWNRGSTSTMPPDPCAPPRPPAHPHNRKIRKRTATSRMIKGSCGSSQGSDAGPPAHAAHCSCGGVLNQRWPSGLTCSSGSMMAAPTVAPAELSSRSAIHRPYTAASSEPSLRTLPRPSRASQSTPEPAPQGPITALQCWHSV